MYILVFFSLNADPSFTRISFMAMQINISAGYSTVGCGNKLFVWLFAQNIKKISKMSQFEQSTRGFGKIPGKHWFKQIFELNFQLQRYQKYPIISAEPLNWINFTFAIQPKIRCVEKLNAIFIVHSRVENFERRSYFRNTYLNDKLLKRVSLLESL